MRPSRQVPFSLRPVRAPRSFGAPRALAPALLAMALTGCAYVSPSAVEDKIDSLDHDGDGAPYGGKDKDCDDFNPNVAPHLEEIPYDGLDNDCKGGDLVDVDGDGFPGISRADWELLNPQEEWPANVHETLVDCMDDPAIHPDAARIYPGAIDTPYDGIDSDCARDNDFDRDGDGFMPDTFILNGKVHDTREAYARYIQEWGYEELGQGVFGDCDDFKEEVYPDAPGDVWYDGIDHDCDGRNDFDADGDGYMPKQSQYQTRYQDYIDWYFGGNPPWGEALWGDCKDHEDDDVPGIPEEIYPGAPDAWYDGIDSDCAGDNDFDADGDGVIPDSVPGVPDVPAAFQEYLDAWGYNIVALTGDCDDNEPTVAPGQLEFIGDDLDSDCDGRKDHTPWATAYQWREPHSPVLIATNQHYVLSAQAAALPGVTSTDGPSAMALMFARPVGGAGAGYMASPDSVAVWQGSIAQPPLGLASDLVADGDWWWAATTYTLPLTGLTNITVKPYEFDSGHHYTARSHTELFNLQHEVVATSVDLLIDDDHHPWAVACARGTLAAMKGVGTIQQERSAILGKFPLNCDNENIPCADPGPQADICFFEGPPTGDVAVIHTCEAGVDCQSYEFDADSETLTASVIQPWSGHALDGATQKDGWTFARDSTDGGYVVSADQLEFYTILRGDYLHTLDGIWFNDELWVVAVVDVEGERTVRLAWGDPTVDDDGDGVADLETRDYPLDDPDLIPQAAVLFVDADRLVLGATALHATDATDVLTWMFLGRRP